ncbi:MAG: DUF2752 domain-containing protein, partial [Pirellulaceae bacterium]
MFAREPYPTHRLSLVARIGLAGCGLTLAGLLFVAGSLQPDVRRWGTHQQLGLPPCSIQTWYRVRCPSCGMTTAWAHVMRGQWPAALRANVGGTVLAVTAALACPWCLGAAWRGRWLAVQPTDGL